MAVIPRSADDIIIDNMVARLRTFAAAQVLIDPAVRFTVQRDMIRWPAREDLPLINIWLESVDPSGKGASAKTNAQDRMIVNVDCYARAEDEADGTDNYDDATVAMARLYYLKEQARYGLYDLEFADLGLNAGLIASKSWPRWRIFMNDAKLPEAVVVAGRWTLEVTFDWQPQDSVGGPELERIAVDAGLWQAYYDFEEV